MSDENKTVEGTMQHTVDSSGSITASVFRGDDKEYVFRSPTYQRFEIDFDKVNELSDVIRIMKAMRITITISRKEQYDDIMDLLKEVNINEDNAKEE
jgi:hypothetical protein